MRTLFILIMLLLNLVVIAQPREMKVKAYNINVKFDLKTKQFVIKSKLSIQKNASLRTIPLLLSKNADIISIKSPNLEDVKFHFSGKDTLVISLPEKLSNSKKITLLFSYVFPVDSFIVNRGMYVLKRFNRWYPLKIGDIFNANLTVNVPDNLITISNGLCKKKYLTNHRATFNWETSSESDLALFVINPDSMEYKSEVVEGTTMNYYFVPDLKDEQKIISLVKSSFSYYSGLLGKYQNKNFTVIEIPAGYYLGQGIHTLLLFTSTLLEYILDPGAWVPHEVGHQWIGNSIQIDLQSKGGWFIEESLTEYLRAMYVEHEYGTDSLSRILKDVYLANYNELVKEGQDVSVLDVVSVNNSIEEAQSIYAKGPIILHQLRRCMGDENWKAMIKMIYTDYQGRFFALEDFRKCISKYDTNGKCLKLFDDLLIIKRIPGNLSFD